MPNRKQLISPSRPMRVVPNAISKKQYPRCSYRWCFAAELHTRENRALHRGGWRAIHRGATPVNVYGKKVIGLRVCPAAHFPRVFVTERSERNENISLLSLLSSRQIVLRMTRHLKIAYSENKGEILSNYFTLYRNINWIFIPQYWPQFYSLISTVILFRNIT